MVTHNFEFKNSYVLPRFSTFQNIVCARNYFLSKFNSKPKIEKLFITSFRESRISNISELTEFFAKRKF